jgi:hypothetical protein
MLVNVDGSNAGAARCVRLELLVLLSFIMDRGLKYLLYSLAGLATRLRQHTSPGSENHHSFLVSKLEIKASMNGWSK